MVGPSLVALAVALGGFGSVARADEPKPGEATKPAPAEKIEPGDLAQRGEDPPAAFVPKSPRTVGDQKKVEATRLYAEARSLEDRRQLSEAIVVLEKALASDPESIPVLRRLARLCNALGRTDKAIEYSRKVIAVEPDDTETIARLVEHYRNRRRDVAKAEALLKEVLANPKLDKASAGALLLEFELAKLYAVMQRFGPAADALAKVVDALDDKAALKLSPGDQRRILGGDEGDAYLQFGLIFTAAKRRDYAIKSYQRGLVYDEDNPQLPLLLAEAYGEDGRNDEALALVERYIRRQPQGRPVYDLLAQILTKMKREKEILPKLEAAAKVDVKNVALQYALADRLREAGQVEKADALLKSLIEVQPDLQGFAALYASLLKDRKSEELLQLLAKVTARIRREDAARPQIEALVADPAYTDRVLDAGLAMLTSKPPRLDRSGWFVLIKVATTARKPEKLAALLRWSLKETPDPIVSRELIRVLFDAGKFAEAEAEVEALMARFPEEKNAATLLLLAQVRLRANKEDAAIAVLKDVLKGAPNESDAIRLLAFALNQKGQTAEAVTTLRDALKADPANLDLLRGLAFVYQQAGKDADLLAFLKSLVDKYPNNEEVVRFARSNLSVAYTTAGDFAKGEAELELLIAKTPDDPGVNNDLGYLYADQGKNLEKAEAMIRKAVSDEPENASYLDSLGWVLFKRGKAREAVAPLEKAIQFLQQEDATIHEHLGDVFFEIKDRARAKSAWEKAEAIAAGSKPPDKRLAEIRKKIASLNQLLPAGAAAGGANP